MSNCGTKSLVEGGKIQISKYFFFVKCGPIFTVSYVCAVSYIQKYIVGCGKIINISRSAVYQLFYLIHITNYNILSKQHLLSSHRRGFISNLMIQVYFSSSQTLRVQLKDDRKYFAIRCFNLSVGTVIVHITWPKAAVKTIKSDEAIQYIHVEKDQSQKGSKCNKIAPFLLLQPADLGSKRWF